MSGERYAIRLEGEVLSRDVLPTARPVVVYPQAGGVSLSGRAIGAAGWPYAVIRFDRMDLDAFRWWIDLVEALAGEGAQDCVLSDVLLPDPRGEPLMAFPMADGGTADLGRHRAWDYGLLSLPRGGEDAYYQVYRRHNQWNIWHEGQLEIRITQLGRGEL